MTAVITDQETISWIAVADALPDSETTVLVHAPGSDEPVWLGYYDDGSWFAIGGEEYGNEDEFAAEVTSWATMPMGPAR